MNMKVFLLFISLLFPMTFWEQRHLMMYGDISRVGVPGRDPTNPIFHPSGAWTCGRAIDARGSCCTG